MAQLKSTKVFGDLNVTGEVNASTKITVNGEEVWDTGNLLNIGTTAATARTALGLGAGATRWPTFAEVTGKPATYAPSGHTHPISQVTGLDTALADKADKTTQVIAGTGLTGGGTLSENRTLAVSYGTTAGTSVQGNDTRVVNAVPNSRTITAGTGLSGGGTLAANRTLSVSYGTAAGTAAQGNDVRINNGQTAFGWGSHASEGYAKTKADVGLSGIPDTNASTVNFLRGDGTWVTPPNTNTTYSEISTAEIDAGTASTLRTITGRRMKHALDKKANTGTQVIAGTGLTGGGTLAANRTLAVSYGTAAGTAAQGDDSRITGALQSSQVVQATGTSTTNVMSQKATTDQLATKAASSHTHTWAQVTGQPATATRWPTFAEVTGKPTNFATTWASVASKPAQATRWPTLAEVTGKPTNYPTNWATVSDKPIVQTVGTSTTNLMSQKAVTDALGAFGQPTMTGSATLNGTTGNTVQLANIVTDLGLEVGDVIRIQYSGYDKLHSVESITNNNLIVVNYEHSGSRGNGSLKLADQTATVTITRIAKWHNAPLGLGQAWVKLGAFRQPSTNYTNSTGRLIAVAATRGGLNALTRVNIKVDGIMDTSNFPAFSRNTGDQINVNSVYADVPAGSVYMSSGDGGSLSLMELR